MTMTDNRDKILNRIFNLRARADDEASSEAEIETCLRRAEELMQAYNVSEAELAIAESDGRVKLEVVAITTRAYRENRKIPAITLIMFGLQKFCTVKTCYYQRTYKWEIVGDKPDVEMAQYIMDMVHAAIPRAYAEWKRAQGGAVGRGAKTAFERAMAARIGRRLYDMANDRDQETKAKAEQARADAARLTSDRPALSTALVIADAMEAKVKEVESEFRRRNPRLGSGTSISLGRNGNASSAGRAAGDRLGLGRPVGGSTTARLA